jgi:tetratricopeptide (TPR) repeat protein
MDIHQAGTTRDRYDYSFSAVTAEAWHVLDQRHHFDYVLLRRPPYPGDQRLDMMDADTTSWALVFMDDAAALYVRRDGPLRALADRFGYRLMGAGAARAVALSATVRRDSTMRARVAGELEREARESKYNSLALTRLGSTAIVEGDLARARRDLERALVANSRAPRAREWLGVVAMEQGRPRDALPLFDEEHRLNQWVSGYDLRRGQAWQRIGDLAKARASYERELKRDPGNQEARDSLASVEARASTR